MRVVKAASGVLAAILLMQSPGVVATSAAGVVAFYNFEGTPGQSVTSIVDDGPNGLHGSVVGNLKYSNDTAPYPSVVGATSLDATADYDFGKVLHSSAFLTPEFTVEVFAKPRYDEFSSDGVTPHTILSKLNTSSSGSFLSAYSLSYDPVTRHFSGTVGFQGVSSLDGISVASTSIAASGEWYHLALTYQQEGALGVLRLYVDGRLEAEESAAYRAPYFGNQSLYIGAGNNAGENGYYRRNFLGNIDALRISDVALTSGQFLIDAQAVPEPSSIVLSLIGALGLIGVAVRRRVRA